MSLLSFLLVLVVLAVIVYGIKLAFAGSWRELIYLVVGLIVAIIILGMLGIQLPNIPVIR